MDYDEMIRANTAAMTCLLTLTLGACQVNQGLQTEVPTVEANTPGPTPTLPMSTENDFRLDELVFSQSKNCKLPCWQGLVPGETPYDDVQAALKNTFGINISRRTSWDFGVTRLTSDELAAQYYSKAYAWYIPSEAEAVARFYLDANFDHATNTLQLLHFQWGGDDTSLYKIHISPLRVIQELGSPPYMWAMVETYGADDYGGVHFLLAYSEGVVFQFIFDGVTFDVVRDEQNNTESITAEICLGTDEVQPESNVEGLLGSLYLMPPLPDDLEDMTPLQASVIADSIEFYHYLPVEDVFDTSLEEIARRAATEDDVCLTASVDD